MRPELQLALDNPDLLSALSTLALVHREIDVIEVGTPLALAEGAHALRIIRASYPEHTILADVRIVKAGGIIAGMMFDAGADRVSVLAEASPETLKAVIREARKAGGEVQIELGENLDTAQARRWRNQGVRQLIFHRSREVEPLGGTAWGEDDLERIRELTELGFEVTVTGGITPDELPLFRGVPVFAFIAGRGIREAPDPLAAARKFREGIQSIRGGSGSPRENPAKGEGR